jgi:hypothetical protein
MSKMSGNREYRDSVFTSYFSDEAKLLEMYNNVRLERPAAFRHF